MGHYASVTGWVAYHNSLDSSVSTDAIRQAIAAAAARSPDPVRETDRESFLEYATQVAAGWHFLSGWGGHGADVAFWSGVIREYDAFLIRDQIEAVAAILPAVPDFSRADGVVGHALQGLFSVQYESAPYLPHEEWRLYGGAVHVTVREVPPSDWKRI